MPESPVSALMLVYLMFNIVANIVIIIIKVNWYHTTSAN